MEWQAINIINITKAVIEHKTLPGQLSQPQQTNSRYKYFFKTALRYKRWQNVLKNVFLMKVEGKQ